MDTTDHEPAQPAKRRRPYFRAEQRQEILARWKQSGLTEGEFAAREQLGHSTLSRWLKEAPPAALKHKPAKVKFQEVVLPPSPPTGTWAVEIVTPRQWRLRLAHLPEANRLQQLLEVLPC